MKQNRFEMRSSNTKSNENSMNSRNPVNTANINFSSGNSNFESSIIKLKNSTLNASASTSVLRNITSVINIKNDWSKEKQNKYLSVSKIYKKVQQNEKGFHTKTISNVKEIINVNRTGQFHDLKIKNSSKRELSS